MKDEIWRPVIGYEGRYEVSNLGRIKSLSRIVDNGYSRRKIRERILSQNLSHSGYRFIVVTKDGKQHSLRVHRLVAMAFIKNPHGYNEVNHKNEIKTDNRVENLEWCNREYNNNYGTRNLRIGIYASKRVAMLDMEGNVLRIFPSEKSAEEYLGVRGGHIGQCCHGSRLTVGGYKWAFI